jgi:hypothetical protein
MTAAAEDQSAAPSPHESHTHHHYSPTHSTAFHPRTPHKLHMHARCHPNIPAHIQPPQYSAIQNVQPTIAWLIAAPRSNSSRTHSTCPSWLAMNSGVQPSVCNTTPCAKYSLYHTSAVADDQGAAPSPHVPHTHHHYAPTHSTALLSSAPHKLHMHARCLPHIPAHIQPPQYSAVQVREAHLRLVDRRAPIQQRPHALHVPILAGDVQWCGPARLQHHTVHTVQPLPHVCCYR